MELLPEDETRVVAGLLAQAWGPGAEIRGMAPIWERRHVWRVRVGPDRSVVVKRRIPDGRPGGFGAELAALEYLNAMPEPVAPRLVAADAAAGIMIMEDLGPGSSLAGALLGRDAERARAGLVAYAEALAAMHAWSGARPEELARLRGRYAAGTAPGPWWLAVLERERAAFTEMAGSLGLAADAALASASASAPAPVSAEIEGLSSLLNGPGFVGLVHGDACPDNVLLRAGGSRVFDFEVSGWGPVALDAAYLLAPFPSCWCFARLPAEAAGPAMTAYRARLEAAGVELGTEWDAALAAAVATFIVARAPMIRRALAKDGESGPTTLRFQVLTWLDSFLEISGRAGVLPSLRAVAEALRVRFRGATGPDYPARAGPGSAPLRVPEWWHPEA